MRTWFDDLTAEFELPHGLREWALGRRDLDEVLSSCPRADWLLWLKAFGAREDAERRRIAFACCACVRASTHGRDAMHIRDIQIAEEWASSGRSKRLHGASRTLNRRRRAIARDTGLQPLTLYADYDPTTVPPLYNVVSAAYHTVSLAACYAAGAPVQTAADHAALAAEHAAAAALDRVAAELELLELVRSTLVTGSPADESRKRNPE